MANRGKLLIGALCVLYAAVRLWRLTDSCIWFDEIFGVHAAEQGWGGMFSFVAQDLIHPPLFYVLLKLWIGIGGEGLLWLRLFPVLFAVLAMFPFLQLCKELKLSAGARMLALSFFAVNGSLIKYAQEVRMYSLLLCLSLFSMWLFARFFYRGKNIWILTLVNILLVHTHYFGWLVVLAEVIAIAIMQRIKIRHVLLMAGLAAISFVPWVLTVWRAAEGGSDVSQNIGWIKPPGARSIFDLSFDLIEPFYFQQSNIEPASVYLITLSLAAVLVIGSVLVLKDREWSSDAKRKALFLAVFVLVPVLVAFAVSWIGPHSIWGTRHLITVFPPVAIGTAALLAAVRPEGPRRMIMLSIFVLFAAAFAMQATRKTPQHSWCKLEEAGREVERRGNGPIYVFEDLAAYQLWFSFRNGRDSKEWMEVQRATDFPEVPEDKAYFLPRGFDEIRSSQLRATQPERMWLIYRARYFDDSEPPLRQLIMDGYEVLENHAYPADGTNAYAVLLMKTKGQIGEPN